MMIVFIDQLCSSINYMLTMRKIMFKMLSRVELCNRLSEIKTEYFLLNIYVYLETMPDFYLQVKTSIS